MKALTLALLLSLPAVQPATVRPLQRPRDQFSRSARKGGQWYFSASGHAVYCYGPVMYITEPEGGLKRVATFCQGDKPVVQLKD
jgi:hypothetical protein